MSWSFTKTQRLALSGRHSWEDFKAIQSVMGKQLGLRLTYLDGEIELKTRGEYHEYIKSMLNLFLSIHFWREKIDFIPVGSATRESEEQSVSFEPDESYYLAEQKDHPDLAIEISLLSDDPQTLEKYQRLGIQEVWMWQDKKFSLYTLNSDNYQEIAASQLLPNLNFSLLEECLLMPSRLQAIQRFTENH
ncbi:protein of unknown function DUF820 [[Leptolyngbya] sp. PCC 7376]|uniref:Uma2 family endonuclease n=1 Tax=[Leptolyngbya] sp. PCC 7376 TaxID=111781 RepID=UPI00029EE400|nr:Uma2 family endonuclease [[Leptolyngbya] sp. PCC 7376]AFY37054.1 protein of unknown function DUF820 [[Leptolyngbya] sp. PCC 7376]